MRKARTIVEFRSPSQDAPVPCTTLRRSRMVRGAALGLLVFFLLSSMSPAEEIERLPAGEVTERLVCESNPDQAYALYLPSSYDPERRSYPILFTLDARGRALVPMERFRPGAEEYGYIIASSYNSSSDMKTDPNYAAWQAMWKDARVRLRIDETRMILAGFSGTVRAGCDLATRLGGKIVGIIGAGAGFPSNRPPTRDTPFAFFGTVGEWDFNYYEMVALEKTLKELRIPHRVEFFEGGHDWMDEELASAALAWMELRAMKTGWRGKDETLIEKIWSRRLEQARSFEKEGEAYAAYRAYEALAADFKDLREVGAVEAKAVELAASGEVRNAVEARDARIEAEQNYLDRAWREIGASSRRLDEPANLRRLLSALEIAKWRARAAHPETEGGKAAKRVLNTISVQTSFYLPQQEAEEGNFPRAAFFLSIASEIQPESPFLWYRLAAAQARADQRKDAVRSLKKAVETGWTDRERLEQDPAFDTLRKKGAFRRILERLD